jgi:hypothetical protein
MKTLTKIISEIKIISGKKVFITERGKDLIQKYWKFREILHDFGMGDLHEVIYEKEYNDINNLYLSVENLSIWLDERIISMENGTSFFMVSEKLKQILGYDDEEINRYLEQLVRLELIEIKI